MDVVDASRWISVRDVLPENARNAVHRYEASVRLSAGSDPWPENDVGRALWIPPGGRRVLVVGSQAGNSDRGMTALGERASFVAADRFSQQCWAAGGRGVAGDCAGRCAGGGGGRSGWGIAGRSLTGSRASDGSVCAPDGRRVAGDRTGAGVWAGALWGCGGSGGREKRWKGFRRSGAGSRRVEIWQYRFLLDASRLMNEAAAAGGERSLRCWAQGVEQAAGMLANDDRVTVITFHNRAEVLADGSRAEVGEKLAERLGGGGGACGRNRRISALGAVEAALRGGTGAAGRRRLVVLVTDGEIPVMDIGKWKGVLGAASVAGNGETRLVIIAPRGAEGEGTALQQLAGAIDGTRWLATDDPHAWRAMLVRVIGNEVAGRA